MRGGAAAGHMTPDDSSGGREGQAAARGRACLGGRWPIAQAGSRGAAKQAHLPQSCDAARTKTPKRKGGGGLLTGQEPCTPQIARALERQGNPQESWWPRAPGRPTASQALTREPQEP